MSHPDLQCARAASLIAAAFLIVTSIALAQNSAPQPLPGESFLGRESGQGVYVRDSAIVLEKFALAQRMERLKEWDKAAEVLQEVVERHADRVVPSQTDADNVIYQYANVAAAVQERLAKWPPEGLEVYNARYGPQAQAMLDAAPVGDVGALHKVYSQFFVTDAAQIAALRLMESYLEAGEFHAAAWLGGRVLQWHPSLDNERRAAALYRTAIAAHLSGDAASAKKWADELDAKYPHARGTVRGKDVVLSASLAEALRSEPPVVRGASGDSWPMPGGSPDRGRVPAVHGRIGAKIFDVEYARPIPRDNRAANAEVRRLREATERVAREAGMLLGVQPVTDRGQLFFQDNARVYAVSLDSGVPLPGWASTHAQRRGQYVAAGAWPLPRNRQFTVTLTEDSVIAVMGQPDADMMLQGLIPPELMAAGGGGTRVVCLDRETGQERWTASPRRFPEGSPVVRDADFTGSPLVVGDNVYVVARGGKPMQFEDAHVVCLGLRDGKPKWSCYLASGNAVPEVWDGTSVRLGDSGSQLAYSAGRLFVLTNLGALAAVDAYTGTITWLNVYPRPKPDVAERRWNWDRVQARTEGRPWSQNPLIVKNGRVFALPGDGVHLVVYDAGSGVEVKRIGTADLEQANTLLGVTDDGAVALAGTRTVFCLDWQSFDPSKPRNENLHWYSLFAQRKQPQDALRGRGFLTHDSLLLTTTWGLHRIALDTGRVIEHYPRDGVWDRSEGPGNVIATRDHVIIAGHDRVSVYTDLAVAQAKLDAEVAAAPDDPETRLRYAEAMFVSGQYDAGLSRLDEAIALLGGQSSMREGASRERAFNVALTFARKLADLRAEKPELAQLVEELFDRAADAAHTPGQQVSYRTTRAQASAAAGDPMQAVRLYQGLLADESLRKTPVLEETSGTTAFAGDAAERAVRQLVKAHGREVYAEFERAAVAALDEARGAGSGESADRLLAVARAYPNASVAAEAMLAAAEAYEAAGRHREATHVLNQAYRKYRDSAGADAVAEIIEAQARNYLHLPNGVGVAIGRLAEASRVTPTARLHDAIHLPNGTAIESGTSLVESLEVLRSFHADVVTRQLPDFKLPVPIAPEPGQPRKLSKPFLPEDPASIVADVDALLVPQGNLSRHDRVVTWSLPRGVSIFAVGQIQPLGTTAALGEQPLGCEWSDKDLLVWGSTKLALLSGDDAAAKWVLDVAKLPPVEVIDGEKADDDAAAVAGDPRGLRPPEQWDPRFDPQVLIANEAARAGRPVRFRAGAGGRLVAIDDAPAGRDGHEQIEHVRLAGDRMAMTTSTGRVLAVMLSDGTVSWNARPGTAPADAVAVNDDFIVTRVTDGTGVQMIAQDVFDGQPVHRLTFPADAGMQPVNFTLSPEGVLVYMLPDRLCGKDLHSADKGLSFEYPRRADGNMIYIGAGAPEQLVIADGRVLAVSDNGSAVRVHALDGGKQLGRPLSTGAGNWAVTLRVIGPRLYAVNQKTVVCYHLDRPTETWTGGIDTQYAPQVRDAWVGKDYVVLLDQPQGPRGAAMPNGTYRLVCYGRYPARPGQTIESGRMDYLHTVFDPAGISAWQPVDGGFYYRSSDRKLHFLRGAAGP